MTLTATARQGETLDALVWRVLGVGSGTVEEAMLLNRGIADAGAVLTEGQTVTLPNTTDSAIPSLPIIQLWN